MTMEIQCRWSPGRWAKNLFTSRHQPRNDWTPRWEFLDWFNGSTEGDWVVKAGARASSIHEIHPFEDGNGRIARAIADLALARSEQSSQRFYSMSAQIRQERADYYAFCKRTRSDVDITPWMDWFLQCLGRAIDGAEATLGTVLSKARFWETFGDSVLNERQRLVVNRLLDGFEGKLTTMKYGSSRNVHTTRHCVTLPHLLNAASWCESRRRAQHKLLACQGQVRVVKNHG